MAGHCLVEGLRAIGARTITIANGYYRPDWSAGINGYLESAGFEDVALYWPCPSLGRAWFWLPLGSAAALEYVRATRLPARNPLRRAVDRPLRAFWHWAAAHQRLWPICAVARPAASPRPAEDLLQRIAEEWTTW